MIMSQNCKEWAKNIEGYINYECDLCLWFDKVA